ncbi:MAG: YbaK/EbsC family protein [Burkholderiales bacterium]|nr:MAG: YbaK/EbsC family protein [Betaproteobacteria bacterium]TAG28955.1 MAG: YbaK/EbsC family protein [Burkholderiales bacterium]TAG45839.1 MAG: YbaK/EbsC family protein [Betaproteobacteria bacterium]
MPTLSPTAQRVQQALIDLGSAAPIHEHAEACRTSAEAAVVLGCSVAQIAKSVIFKGASSGQSILVIASGANRVDTEKIAAIAGETPGKANPDFVREHTGFVIGGVSPIAHLKPGKVIFDQDLLQHDFVFPAGGTPQAMFRIAPDELLRISGAVLADVALVA